MALIGRAIVRIADFTILGMVCCSGGAHPQASDVPDRQPPQPVVSQPNRRAGIHFLRRRPVARLPVSKLAPLYPATDAPEPAPTRNLADAIALAYRSNPGLQARRFDLRATDEGLGLALSELRPTTQLQVTGQYNKTVPGRTTQATRFGALSPIVTSNALNSQFVITQPITTGGKASADIAAANEAIQSGRAGLRAAEGDLLLQTIASYLDVRRDTRELAIRQTNLAQLDATLAEVKARRAAGELTRTDVAEAETQLETAQANANLQRQQLEASRATFSSLVGVDAGVLEPEPPLSHLPSTIDEAFAQADARNPELAQTVLNERASRARISAARAANHPSVSLQGTVGLTGRAYPFYLRNEDQGVTGIATLSIPLTNGGHNGALIGQALDTNSGDRLRIAAARRTMVLNISNAWNEMITARRNLGVQERQVGSARVYYEGSFAEYRAGLRSTFDVLFAQGTLRDAQLALVVAQHDLYVAQAALLRQMGLLEINDIETAITQYDAASDIRHITHRGATPLDPLVRAIDRAERPPARPKRIAGPVMNDAPARFLPATKEPNDEYVTVHPSDVEPAQAKGQNGTGH